MSISFEKKHKLLTELNKPLHQKTKKLAYANPKVQLLHS